MDGGLRQKVKAERAATSCAVVPLATGYAVFAATYDRIQLPENTPRQKG
jgi:hypothetical protein